MGRVQLGGNSFLGKEVGSPLLERKGSSPPAPGRGSLKVNRPSMLLVVSEAVIVKKKNPLRADNNCATRSHSQKQAVIGYSGLKGENGFFHSHQSRGSHERDRFLLRYGKQSP